MTVLDPREQLVSIAHSMHARGLTHGSTGNVSMRVDEGILVTPTGHSLGTVQPDDLSIVALDGRHLDGARPSKETFLHLAVLRARPSAGAVVHTHSTHAAALSCLANLDDEDALPALTAYFAMRVGRLPALPYHAPGDPALEPIAERVAAGHSAFLLRNHGPVVSAASITAALDAAEELEETARLFFLLRGMPTAPIPPQEVARLHAAHSS